MVASTKEDICLYLKSHKDEFLQKYGVYRIGLFGSIVRNEQTETSDIDIAIEMAPDKKNLRNFMAFKRYLENEFGRPVDLGVESTLKPLVREMIKNEIIYV